jgi:hypothetical protein
LTNLSLCYGIYRVGLSIHAPVGWVGAPRPVVEAPPGGPPPGGRRRAAAGWGGRPAQRKHRVADTAPTLDEQRRGSSSSSMAGGARSGVARNRLADLRDFPVEPVAILEGKKRRDHGRRHSSSSGYSPSSLARSHLRFTSFGGANNDPPYQLPPAGLLFPVDRVSLETEVGERAACGPSVTDSD